MHISRERITIAVNPSHLPILLFGQNETRFAMNSSEMGSAYIPVYCCTEPKNYAPPPLPSPHTEACCTVYPTHQSSSKHKETKVHRSNKVSTVIGRSCVKIKINQRRKLDKASSILFRLWTNIPTLEHCKQYTYAYKQKHDLKGYSHKIKNGYM